MNAHSLAPQGSNTKACIEKCQRIIGYRFRNLTYVREALRSQASGNQRLGVIGDRVFDAHLAVRWYDDKQRLSPLQWEIVRKTLLSNSNLAKVGVRFGIQNCTLTRCGTGRSMATTMEAIIAAVWLDSKHDFGAVNSVMDRLGLTKHTLLRLPSTSSTTDQLRCEIQETQETQEIHEIHEIQSNRSLPDRFFVGNHVGLLQLLFRHSQSFILQQHAGQHSNLSRHEPTRLPAIERLSTGMWSRLKHILSTPQIMTVTDQKGTAASQEPSPSDITMPTRQQVPAHVLATREQPNAENDGSALDSTLPIQQSVILSGHDSSSASRQDEPRGWPKNDTTEYRRISYFVWSVKRDRNLQPDYRASLVQALRAHRQVLLKLPGKSLKNMPDGFSTDGVFLMANSADRYSDTSLALQALLLSRKQKALLRKRGRKGYLPPEEHRSLVLLEKQLAKVWRERLELWLPQDEHQDQVPTSLPKSGQLLASSSETPESDLPVTAAVDSTRTSADEPSKDKTPRRPGPVLWTTHADQYKSVEWKQYLSKPTSDTQ